MRYAPEFRLRPRPHRARAKRDPSASSGTRPARAYKANVGVRVAGALLDVLIPSLFPGIVFLIGGYWWAWAIVVGLYLLLREEQMPPTQMHIATVPLRCRLVVPGERSSLFSRCLRLPSGRGEQQGATFAEGNEQQ